MKRITAPIALGLGLALLLALTFLARVHAQDEPPPNPEMQRQEIVNIERETVRAIQLHNGTFFRRVYSDDFHGVTSFGSSMNKEDWIQAIESPTVDYASFIASDINVRLYHEAAVATCLWTWRANLKNQKIYSQMRVLHVYINGARGLKVVASQVTPLPPYVHQVL